MGGEGVCDGSEPRGWGEGRVKMGESASPGQLRPQLQQEEVKLDSREQYHQDGALLQERSQSSSLRIFKNIKHDLLLLTLFLLFQSLLL